MSDPREDFLDTRTCYQELCSSYRAIDDLRTKLLQLLPIVSGIGVAVLGDGSSVATAAGAFGVLATVGLFSYELHGIKKCAHLIDACAQLERQAGLFGQFRRRPGRFLGFIDEPFAASIIYPVSMASWTYLLLLRRGHFWSAAVAGFVLLVGFAVSLLAIRRMEDDLKPAPSTGPARARTEYGREPELFPGRARRATRRREEVPGHAQRLDPLER
jgi:hypothetical protein